MKRKRLETKPSTLKQYFESTKCPVCSQEVAMNCLSLHVSFHFDIKSPQVISSDVKCKEFRGPDVPKILDRYNAAETSEYKDCGKVNALSTLMSNASSRKSIVHFNLMLNNLRLHPSLIFSSDLDFNTQTGPKLHQICEVSVNSLTIATDIKNTEQEKIKLILNTNIQPQHNILNDKLNTNHPISLSVLKSMIQKATRRRLTGNVLRLSLLLSQYSLSDFLRRLPVIVIEDGALHPAFPILVWMMIATSKGYEPPDYLVSICILILVEVADNILKDYLSHEVVPIFQKLIKVHEESFPAYLRSFSISWNLADLPNSSSRTILASLLLRASYGGMHGDKRMLHDASFIWACRIYFSDLISCSSPSGMLSSNTVTNQESTVLLHEKISQDVVDDEVSCNPTAASSSSSSTLASTSFSSIDSTCSHQTSSDCSPFSVSLSPPPTNHPTTNPMSNAIHHPYLSWNYCQSLTSSSSCSSSSISSSPFSVWGTRILNTFSISNYNDDGHQPDNISPYNHFIKSTMTTTIDTTEEVFAASSSNNLSDDISDVRNVRCSTGSNKIFNDITIATDLACKNVIKSSNDLNYLGHHHHHLSNEISTLYDIITEEIQTYTTTTMTLSNTTTTTEATSNQLSMINSLQSLRALFPLRYEDLIMEGVDNHCDGQILNHIRSKLSAENRNNNAPPPPLTSMNMILTDRNQILDESISNVLWDFRSSLNRHQVWDELSPKELEAVSQETRTTVTRKGATSRLWRSVCPIVAAYCQDRTRQWWLKFRKCSN